MGNSKTPKKSGSPERVYPNVYEPDTHGSVVNTGSDRDQISFILIKINRVLTNQAKINEPVTTKFVKDEIEIFNNSGRIGNVPLSRIDTVKKSNFSTGFISHISKDRERIQITLNG